MAIVPDVGRSLSGPEFAAFSQLVERLNQKKTRNTTRQHYYDSQNALIDLGIAIPPRLRTLDAVMGWPAKTVDTLNQRVKMEGFVIPGVDLEDFGIDSIWRSNRMAIEAPMAQSSALIHSVAFILTYLGDPDFGEPEVVIATFDAQHATGLWHPTTRRLGAGLAVFDEDSSGNPLRMLLMFPHAIYSIWRDSKSPRWSVQKTANTLGRVPMEPITYKPRLGRPFGSSRISRPVMAITDSAMRTIVRSEVGAEFFSAPQRYLMGAEEAMFENADGTKATTWDLVMGRMLSIPRDEEFGEVPTVGQFPQISMQPHSDHLNMWVRLFSAETGIPADQLGIYADNAVSAESRYAAWQSLIIEAEAVGENMGPAWTASVVSAIQMRDNLRTPPAELDRLAVRWRDPSTPSRSSAVDAVVKEIQVDLLPADSEVALERAGYSEVDIQRIIADRARSASRQALDDIMRRLGQARTVSRDLDNLEE